MKETDDILAVPLWINGHAFLTMAPAFFDVRDPRSGLIRRRTPLCGAGQAATAVDAAAAALLAWRSLAIAERAQLLAKLADALAGYGSHFAGLIAEESGQPDAAATAEVEAALCLLRRATSEATVASSDGGVVAIVCDDRAPLAGLLQRAVPTLLAGSTVVAKPSPKAPSVAVALAELMAQSGFLAGAFNVLHGDLEAIEGLCAAPALGRLLFSGEAALGRRVAEIAGRHGRQLAD
ncbi:MAG: aldehyde dehydrogenase family protein [Accumulibacter sp.]|jgi:succinate-semialdehyde dehydrogenase/glutarate-semialdehyde dehydrogenase|uniref:aldehyde dehydrogenase family protein n=1 Tax=Accumulibacter sp. TaxID=2053492 RepID=UPI002FC29689